MKEVKKLLKKAIRDGLTGEEHQRLTELAESWNVCAIGENRRALKRAGYRFVGKKPFSKKLRCLGLDFPGYVVGGLFGRAFGIYKHIETLAHSGVRIGRPSTK